MTATVIDLGEYRTRREQLALGRALCWIGFAAFAAGILFAWRT